MMSSIVSRGLQSLLIVGLAGTVTRAQSSGQGTVTTGEVSGSNCGVVTACTSGLRVNFNPQVCGTVTAPDGSRWAVPSAVHDGPAAVDVYNDCTGPGDIPDYLAKVPTVVIDPDGVEITGHIFADNYYELYVNGTFVAKDGIGMTPFNSTVVRFRARYPMTYAIKAVDWETHPGVGLEYRPVQRRRWRVHRPLQRRHRDRARMEDRDVLHRAARRPELRHDYQRP